MIHDGFYLQHILMNSVVLFVSGASNVILCKNGNAVYFFKNYDQIPPRERRALEKCPALNENPVLGRRMVSLVSCLHVWYVHV